MGRMLRKEWKNKRSGWSFRIRWFEGDGIRLQLEDPERKINVYPRDRERAEEVWFQFKLRAKEETDADKK